MRLVTISQDISSVFFFIFKAEINLWQDFTYEEDFLRALRIFILKSAAESVRPKFCKIFKILNFHHEN